jgi:hypothetical protein
VIRFLAFCVALGTLVSCSDSTSPSEHDIEISASQFDALANVRGNAGDIDGARVSHQVAAALRAGVRPTRVRIAVDGTTEDYRALEIEHAFGDDVTESPVLTLPIVLRSMVAWRGSPPTRVISITVPGDTGEFSWEPLNASAEGDERVLIYPPARGIMFERRGPPFFAIDGGARSTRQTIGAECQAPMSPLSITPPSCHVAAFFTRFNMRAQEAPIGGASAMRARVIEMGGHDVGGIRLEYRPPCPACA